MPLETPASPIEGAAVALEVMSEDPQAPISNIAAITARMVKGDEAAYRAFYDSRSEERR